MPDIVFSDGLTGREKARDMGDGTFARIFSNVAINPDGSTQSALPAGRADATQSVPTVLSNQDKAALDNAAGVYRRATAVGATGGDGLFVTGVTTAGTITVTLANGGSLTVSVPLGSSIFPFSVTAAALGTAVGGTFQSLFFV